jgi:hypothetical protein
MAKCVSSSDKVPAQKGAAKGKKVKVSALEAAAKSVGSARKRAIAALKLKGFSSKDGKDVYQGKVAKGGPTSGGRMI